MSDITINKPVADLILATLDGVQTARMQAISDYVDLMAKLHELGIDTAALPPISIDNGQVKISGEMQVNKDTNGSIGLAFSAFTGGGSISRSSKQALSVEVTFAWKVDTESPVTRLTAEQVAKLR